MQSTLENYLKTIFNLCQSDLESVVKVSHISKRLGISAPAVTDMVRKLQSEGYVTNKPYKGVSLTPTGREVGRNMVRRHRLWEAFLHQELGLPWDKVHDEAERLEHACSDMLIDTLEKKLGFPKTDPHGNPIPQRDGDIPELPADVPLSEKKEGSQCMISRVVDLDREFLKYIESIGIGLGEMFTIKSVLDFDNTVICLFDNKEISFSGRAAQHIYVIEK